MGARLSAVTTLGYLGFLAGPAIIGGAAEIGGLRVALGLVVTAALIIALGARAVHPRAVPPAVGCNRPLDWASNSPQPAR